MIGEIISDVMTDGFFPSTMVSGNPAAKLSHAATQSAWSRLLQLADHNWPRVWLSRTQSSSNQHFE
ncbi:hypothetical protein [Tardiphaga sp. 839_C3_N1_4]|jgi:hypothetical protein|uniref:hypothetical protein n=1 Tax=Tardiphaga sp. 839_C3_N1_4 TaxID=3240761 RepID=UPI003F1E6E3C